jgi:hypothetical protein
MKNILNVIFVLVVLILGGCGTSTLKSGEQFSVVHSNVSVYGGDVTFSKKIIEQKPIVAVNGGRSWPALPDKKIVSGNVSVQLLGKCPNGNLLLCQGGNEYAFNAIAGRRYELAPSMIYASDATQDSHPGRNKTIYRAVMLKGGVKGAVVQSAIDSITGGDILQDRMYPIGMPSVIELRFGYENSIEEDFRLMMRSGNLLGESWRHSIDKKGRILAIVKNCNDALSCKILVKYSFIPEAGKRYELGPNGRIYVSNAYEDPVQGKRNLLSDFLLIED